MISSLLELGCDNGGSITPYRFRVVVYLSIEPSFQKMEKTKSLKFTGTENSNHHSTFAWRESATNTDLMERKAKVVEEQQEHMAYQGSKGPQNLGLVSKI